MAYRGVRELGSIASQVNTFAVRNVIGIVLILVEGIWLPRSGNKLHDLFGVPLSRVGHSNHCSDSDDWTSIHECHAVLASSKLNA